MREKINYLKGECSAYLLLRGWPNIYIYIYICFLNWRVVRILSHWMGYFLPLLDLIRDVEGAVY